MPDIWTLEDVDRDGAIQEAAAQVDPLTRASFLKKAGVGAGAVVGGGALMGAIPSLAFGAGFPASDVAILNFALTSSTSRPRSTTRPSRRGASRATQTRSPVSSLGTRTPTSSSSRVRSGALQ